MYAADMNALSLHGESAVSQAPASPQASIQKAEPDTPVASYMHILENSGPPSPLQFGRFGDSPATQRYKRWYWRQSSMSLPETQVLHVSSDEEVLLQNPSSSSTAAVGVADMTLSDDMPEATGGRAFSEALRSRGPDVPEPVWPTRAGPTPLFERGRKRRPPRPAYRGVFLLMGDGGVFLQVRFFWKDFPCVVKILEASFRFVLLACFLHMLHLSLILS